MIGVESSLEMTDCCPACINDAAMADLVRLAAADADGVEQVTDNWRTAGADDMSLFLNAVPGCYFFVGGANAERGLASPHHSPTFDFDERALDIGVNVLMAAALRFLDSA